MEETVITQILRDGTPRGIIQTNLDEWVGVCYKIPRNKFKEISKLNYIDKTGIYILIGQDESSSKDIAYIGKTTNMLKRLTNHNKNKGFWSEAIVFVSQNNTLNEAHIGYIESILCSEAKEVGRYVIENEQKPTTLDLSSSEKIIANKFLLKIKLIVSLYGYRIFDKIIDNKVLEENILYLTNNKIEYAKGMMTDEGFVILKGSRLKEDISQNISPSLLNYAQRERSSEDITNGIFTKDHLCSTPSMAAVVILGRNSNGYLEWTNKEGKKLKETIDIK